MVILSMQNPNSSRFGKLISLCFDEHNRVVSANITEYLLEKARIVSQVWIAMLFLITIKHLMSAIYTAFWFTKHVILYTIIYLSYCSALVSTISTSSTIFLLVPMTRWLHDCNLTGWPRSTRTLTVATKFYRLLLVRMCVCGIVWARFHVTLRIIHCHLTIIYFALSDTINLSTF